MLAVDVEVPATVTLQLLKDGYARGTMGKEHVARLRSAFRPARSLQRTTQLGWDSAHGK